MKNRLQRTLLHRISPDYILLGEAIDIAIKTCKSVSWTKKENKIIKYMPFHIKRGAFSKSAFEWSRIKLEREKWNIYSDSKEVDLVALNSGRKVISKSEIFKTAFLNMMYGQPVNHRLRFWDQTEMPIPEDKRSAWYSAGDELWETGYLKCMWRKEYGLLLIERNSYISWVEKYYYEYDVEQNAKSSISGEQMLEFRGMCAYAAKRTEEASAYLSNENWYEILNELAAMRSVKLGDPIIKKEKDIWKFVLSFDRNVKDGKRASGRATKKKIDSGKSLKREILKMIRNESDFKKTPWWENKGDEAMNILKDN